MVSMNDYSNFGSGFGAESANYVHELAKALTTGAYTGAQGSAARMGGSPLIPESLEHSLKVLTYGSEQFKLWRNIAKTPAYSTVEEYNQLESYGGNASSGFIPEGMLPETEDSRYKRKSTFVKFLGTTREVTHPMMLVRSAHGDIISIENQNGILWLMRMLENSLFWGNSKLAPNGKEGIQFDGIANQIDPNNVVNCKGKDFTDLDINSGAQMILENFGTPNQLYLPFDVMKAFSESYFPKERVIMPTPQGGMQAGVVVSDFQTHGGSVKFNPDIFLQRTKPLDPSNTGGVKSPTAPASVALSLGTLSDAEFSNDANGGVGTYNYAVTAVNRYGESTPVTASSSIALAAGDQSKGIVLTITNDSAMVVTPEYFSVYRTECDGTIMYKIADIPATSDAPNAATVWTDTNDIMPNTCSAFMGDMSPEVLTFRQLAPIMKMDLATLGPSMRWMILLYGTPILFMPGRWVRFKNIKANSAGNPELYAG